MDGEDEDICKDFCRDLVDHLKKHVRDGECKINVLVHIDDVPLGLAYEIA